MTGLVAGLTGRPAGPPLRPAAGLLEYAVAQADRIRSAAPEVCIDGPAELGLRAALHGWGRHAPWTVGGAGTAVEASDGWVAVTMAREQDTASIPAVVGDPGARGWASLETWARERPADEVAARLQLLEVPAGTVPLEPRRTSSAVETTPLRSPLPRVGTGPPLVVDLSSLWAGPLCARILGLAGCRVVKVESGQRPDGSRLGDPAFFDYLHAGHRSVVVDFATDDGRRALAGLLARADVVIESSRPRALRALSLGPEQARPGVVWVAISAYGRTPMTEQLVGFGDDVAGAAGGWVLDPDSGVPFPSLDAVADPLTGLTAAAAALEALSGGGGMLLDVAMHRVVTEAVEGRPTLPAQVWPGQETVQQRPTVTGHAPALGEHTAEVLAQVGLRP